MEQYKVKISKTALHDIIEIRDYIAITLDSPMSSEKLISLIFEEIRKLSYLASSFSLIKSEPFKSIGIRRSNLKNYYFYYRIIEEKKQVDVITVIYYRRQQLKVLKEKMGKYNDENR